MRSATLAPLLLASACAHSLPELSLAKRDKLTNAATNHFRRAVGTHQLEKRAGTLGTTVFNVMSWSLGGAYYVNVTVGTPPQDQTLILDTGSSDTYFDASSSQECSLPASNPSSCQGGTFDHSKSTSYHQVEAAPAFNASYGDGSTAIGPFGEDIIGIGSITVSPVQFGVAEEINSTTGYSIGLMGIGYSQIEAVQGQDFYPNIPEVLADAGVINSRLYSLYLNDDRAISGTILFGGIDRSKYTGDIATMNFLPSIYDGVNIGVNQFITTVTAASVTSSGQTTELWSGGSAGIAAYGSDDTALPILLDSGSTAWTVPQSYYNQAIAPAFSFVDQNGFCSCQYASSGDYLSLEFGGKVTIKVDASEFIVPLINTTTREPVPYDNAGNNACVFLISPDSGDSGMNFQTLGDSILRSMYIVYDLDNGQASIAQAAVNSTSSPDVVTVEAGPTGVAAAISNVMTAAANSYSIAAEVTGSAASSFSVGTAATPIGTNTGSAAVPGDAQTETSSGVAAAVVIPTADFTGLWMSCICMVGVALGAGLML